ncbi:MAG: hypothetical protein ABEI52_13030 [Halobacteriaceae archaeon]
MTITESDEETYQATVSDFQPQITADACLPTAIKNILDDLAERQDIDGMSMSQSDVNDLCGYKEGFFSEEEIIPEQLTHEVSDYGYEARESTAADMDFDRLEAIIENDDASLPIVELDPDYFREVDGYRVQEAEHMPSHTVIVHHVNDDEVLYYDPYEKFFEDSSRIDEAPYTWPKTGFFELWSGRYEERWTLWIDRSEQPTLEQFG